MPRPSETPSVAWGLFLFLAGIALAPMLFGSVNPPQQAIIGALFGGSLCLLIFELRCGSAAHTAITLGWALVVFCGMILPLIPLPAAVVALLSPERLALARAFSPAENGPVKFLTLTLSPAATMQRVWELALLAACFTLSRNAARLGADRAFSMTLSAALLALAASEIWYRLYGHGKLLGLWPDSAGHAAGTFANRNHFADWVFVASLFVLGWMAQRAWGTGTPGQNPEKENPEVWGEMIFSALAVALGAFMAVLTGSRGALVAFVVGLVVLALSLMRPRRGRRIHPAFLLTLLALGAVFVYGAGYALDRFASVHSLSLKISMWRDAWKIALKFPLCGTGPGTFETAFGLYKTFGGDTTFLFAENDYLQAAVESGFFVCALFFALLTVSLAGLFRFACAARSETSALMFGGLAALAAFLVHCVVEFVFEVTATALLAAALFGYLHGLRDRATLPVVCPPPGRARLLVRLACALALLALCGLQFAAWRHGRAASQAKSALEAAAQNAESLRLWPGDPGRVEIFQQLADYEISRRSGSAMATRAEIDRALRLDPLNWRLRWEAFPLYAANHAAQASNEAWRIIRLNPLQAASPLHFAWSFAGEGAATALPFMRAAADFPENLGSVFNLAWKLEPGSDLLWKVTPNTDGALQALGDYALGKSLRATALAAFERISDKASPSILAQDFLHAGRPDLTLKLLSGHSASDHYFRSQALFQLGKFVEAIHAAEAVWADIAPEWESGVANPRSLTKDQAAALGAAEAIYRAPAEGRDLAQLRRLADASSLPRIGWMVFDTERALGRFEAAAKSGLRLAAAALRSQQTP